MNEANVAIELRQSLEKLIAAPNMRPFLFRTRFERTMLRLSAYAEKMQRPDLAGLAAVSLSKLRAIADKSNTTAEGELRSHVLLAGDMQEILNRIQ